MKRRPAAGAPGVQGAALPAGVQGRSPASLDKEATTITSDADDERLKAVSDAAQPGRARLAARWARKAEATGSKWHRARSLALGVTIAERVKGCGKEHVELFNPNTGERLAKPVGCRQRLCPDCTSKRARRTAGRIKRAFQAHDALQRRRGRRRWMITLTAKHSGHAWLDARRIQRAWQLLRASYYARQVRAVKRARGAQAKVVNKGFDFVRILELAGGSRRTGHAHLHVVVYLPRWNSWEWFQGAWRAALGTADEQLQEELQVMIPADAIGVGNVDFATNKAAEEAQLANYVSKLASYVGKAGTDLLQLDTQAAGEFLGQFVGRRWITTSVRFWPIELDRPAEWMLSATPQTPDRSHLAGWWLRLGKPPDGS